MRDQNETENDGRVVLPRVKNSPTASKLLLFVEFPMNVKFALVSCMFSSTKRTFVDFCSRQVQLAEVVPKLGNAAHLRCAEKSCVNEYVRAHAFVPGMNNSLRALVHWVIFALVTMCQSKMCRVTNQCEFPALVFKNGLTALTLLPSENWRGSSLINFKQN